MGSDDEGNDSEAVRGNSLDGEEKVGTVSALEVVDRWVKIYVQMATPGVQLKGFFRV